MEYKVKEVQDTWILTQGKIKSQTLKMAPKKPMKRYKQGHYSQRGSATHLVKMELEIHSISML